MTEDAEPMDPVSGEIRDQEELPSPLLEQTREQAVNLVGLGGLLAGVTVKALRPAETWGWGVFLVADLALTTRKPHVLGRKPTSPEGTVVCCGTAAT